MGIFDDAAQAKRQERELRSAQEKWYEWAKKTNADFERRELPALLREFWSAAQIAGTPSKTWGSTGETVALIGPSAKLAGADTWWTDRHGQVFCDKGGTTSFGDYIFAWYVARVLPFDAEQIKKRLRESYVKHLQDML